MTATGNGYGSAYYRGLLGRTTAQSKTSTPLSQLRRRGLVDQNGATCVARDWDTTASGLTTTGNVEGKLTTELQTPTRVSHGHLRHGHAPVRDFGAATDYPTLAALKD